MILKFFMKSGNSFTVAVRSYALTNTGNRITEITLDQELGSMHGKLLLNTLDLSQIEAVIEIK